MEEPRDSIITFGILPAVIGDLDGDGVSEFVVTAIGNDEAGSWLGKGYLYDGRTGALLRTHLGLH